jgi:hypothetical protein
VEVMLVVVVILVVAVIVVLCDSTSVRESEGMKRQRLYPTLPVTL